MRAKPALAAFLMILNLNACGDTPGPDGLAGRILATVPSAAHGSDLLVALDTASGTVTPLWPVFEPDEQGRAHDWAIAPGGDRVAYLGKGGTEPVTLVVRDLAVGAPARRYALAGDRADMLLWTPDGSGIVYGRLELAGVADTGLAHVSRWELRHLDLASGEDRVVVSQDDEALGRRFPRLTGYDAATGRAALLLGPGENFFVDTIRLLETGTGTALADLTTMDEGFVAVASPDGRQVAFGECVGCNAAGLGEVKVLAVDAGPEIVTRLGLGQKVVGLRWAADMQHLAWTVFIRTGTDDAQGGDQQMDYAKRTRTGWQVESIAPTPGSAVAFSPDNAWLLGSRTLVELATGRTWPIPWAAPSGMAWDEAPWRVVAWVP